jgi:hypothetical protein
MRGLLDDEFVEASRESSDVCREQQDGWIYSGPPATMRYRRQFDTGTSRLTAISNIVSLLALEAVAFSSRSNRW